ncbi:MAG: Gfo/Idh/MocA family protein [Planctomycetota bacterium]
MERQPVRYGVISAGRMAGFTMLKLMRGHPAARAEAWYELDPARPDTAERIDRLAGSGIARCDSFAALLGRDDVDVILNVTPHFAHAGLSIAALDAGRPVVCEKPPAVARRDARDMLAAAERTDLPLLIHFQHLLRPAARWLNRQLVAGAVGRIRRVSCLSQWFRQADYYRRTDWAGRRRWRGRLVRDGALNNQTVHYLNQMLAFAAPTGEAHVARPASMRAALYRFHQPDVLEMEDTAVVAGTLAGAAGTKFLFAGTTVAAGRQGPTRAAEYAGLDAAHRIVIEGDRGTATWSGEAEIRLRDGRVLRREDSREAPWPFYDHIRNVLDGAEQPVTPIAESAKVVDFICDAYDTAGDIRQRSWDDVAEVAPVLRRCAEEFALPEDLSDPPDWA